jgi:hypothetical protein
MLRPTRSRLVTEIDIGPARPSCNMIKSNSLVVQIMGILRFAPEAAMNRGSTRGLSPRLQNGCAFLGNVAGDWRDVGQSSRPIRAVP